MNGKKLLVLVGPTAVGKTDLSLKIAKTLDCHIISADSRQFYKDLIIGTAAPTQNDLNSVKHHFVGFLKPDEYYNASAFETDVLKTLDQCFEPNNVALLTGGSMLYIDAVVKGIDDMPDVDPLVRKSLYMANERGEIEQLRNQLMELDPVYYREADVKNPVRVIHALEVCLTTGKPFSHFRLQKPKERPFTIIKIGLERSRNELYDRINKRVIAMVEAGLVDEVASLKDFRETNALNTVGYKEVFPFLDNLYGMERAIELISRNTRRYAKKQMTWFKKDPATKWFHPDQTDEIMQFVLTKIASD